MPVADYKTYCTMLDRARAAQEGQCSRHDGGVSWTIFGEVEVGRPDGPRTTKTLVRYAGALVCARTVELQLHYK
jgi:hypothetical protein